MLNVSAERSEDALAFQRELVAVVDKWVSRVEASEGDAFIKELLGYYRIRRMLVDSLDRVAFARALGTGNLLRLVEDDFFKVRLAILANVFVDWHAPLYH